MSKDPLSATFTITFSESDSRLIEYIARFQRRPVNDVLSDLSGADRWQKHITEVMGMMRSKFGFLVNEYEHLAPARKPTPGEGST